MRALLLNICLAAALAGSVVACARKEEAPTKSGLVTFVATVGDIRDIVPATGALMSMAGADVRASRAGVITAVLVTEGQTVRAGQVLATMEDPGRAAVEAEASANARSFSASLEEAQIALRSARLDLDRRRTLQRGGFVSAAAVETAEVETQRAQAAVDRARNQHQAAQARLMSVAAQAQTSDVRAPLDGKVTLVLAKVGQRVAPEDERPLFKTEAADTDLLLEIMIAETDIARVGPDSQVMFTVDAFPDIRNQATLESIGTAPIREGRFVSYRAVARYDNRAGVLTPGMTASVELIQADSRNVLRVPAQALSYRPPGYVAPLSDAQRKQLMKEYNNNETYVRAAAEGMEFGRHIRNGTRLVFLLKDGKLEQREVRIGAQAGDYAEILSGISKGEVIVVRGADERSR